MKDKPRAAISSMIDEVFEINKRLEQDVFVQSPLPRRDGESDIEYLERHGIFCGTPELAARILSGPIGKTRKR